MSVADKSKHIYRWFLSEIDVTIHCMCGEYVYITDSIDNAPQQYICSNCNQHWYAYLMVHPQEPDGAVTIYSKEN